MNMELENNNKLIELKEEGQLRRSERKKVPSLWYIEHLNEYKKTAGKKNSGLEDKSGESSELSSPIQTQYLPFLAAPQVYLDMMQTGPGTELKSGYVAFVLKSHPRKSKELNRSKNMGNRTGFIKPTISKKKPQRKFHQTFSSANRLKGQKSDKKTSLGMNMVGSHKKTENNNNILDMILSAAMKVKKDPTTTEPHHKTHVKNGDDHKPKQAVVNANRVAMDGGYLKKAAKKNNKLVFEHSTKGTFDIEFVEKKDPSCAINYQKLFQSRLFEACFGVEKQNFISGEIDKKNLEAVANEKLQELKDSFQEMKKNSLIFT